MGIEIFKPNLNETVHCYQCYWYTESNPKNCSGWCWCPQNKNVNPVTGVVAEFSCPYGTKEKPNWIPDGRCVKK